MSNGWIVGLVGGREESWNHGWARSEESPCYRWVRGRGHYITDTSRLRGGGGNVTGGWELVSSCYRQASGRDHTTGLWVRGRRFLVSGEWWVRKESPCHGQERGREKCNHVRWVNERCHRWLGVIQVIFSQMRERWGLWCNTLSLVWIFEIAGLRCVHTCFHFN